MIDIREIPLAEFATEHDYNEAVKVAQLLNTIMEYQDRGLWVFAKSQRITWRFRLEPNEGDFLMGVQEYRPRIDVTTVGEPYVSRWSRGHHAITGSALGPIQCNYEWVLKNHFPELHYIDPAKLKYLPQ